jgi:hypothetical protein
MQYARAFGAVYIIHAKYEKNLKSAQNIEYYY